MNWYMGYDRREDLVYQVARASLLQTSGVHVIPLVQDSLRAHRIYTRDDDRRAATDFSLTRFLVPYLAGTEEQWAFFSDCDFLFTRDLGKVLPEHLDDSKAVMVVKHRYTPRTSTKMGGMQQYPYPRKNWSSFIAWNLKHEANQTLDAAVVNAAEPSWLHQFQWLDDSDIGGLPGDFNFLVGEYDGEKDADTLTVPTSKTPSCLHYTLGIGPFVPPVKDYEPLWNAYRKTYMASKHVECEPIRSVQ